MREDDQPAPFTAGQTLSLVAHPAHLAAQVRSVSVRLLAPSEHWISLRWRVERAGALVVPAVAGRGRADGLWRTTCFELFVSDAGEGSDAGYAEFNLSPSERWAAYDFSGHRAGMTERTMPRDPVCTFRGSGDVVLFEAAIPRAGLPSLPASVGISAVIEEAGGVRSFWALSHSGGEPDFHQRRSFAALLMPDSTD